jgi:hydrophobic/amphiphilic exporter-1 (mainly G- bacteria), HAE1 family
VLISDLAIRRPIITITVILALVAFGLVALWRLQTDEFPDIQQPVISVTIAYPGASPDVVEREIVRPVEEAIFSISGVDPRRTTSSAIDGLAQFTVFFDFEKDLQQASQDIRDAISAERQDLPQEMKEPILTRFDPSEMPVLTLTLTSPSLPQSTLTRLADPTITRELRGLPGVAQVRVVGAAEPEMTVQVKPAALQAAGLSIDQVVAALEAQNLAAPVGRLNRGFEERAIRLQGRLTSAAEFAELVVAERGGHAIRLGEVASVFAGSEEARTLALFNGREAVGLEVLKAKGYSTTEVSERIHERVAALRQTLPKEAHFEIVQDAGVRVTQAVGNVKATLVEGALLTVLVVFLFLNSWRSTVITGLALPVSVLAAFIGVWVFGFTLNTMSLLGLSLAIGILIDDAIVVRENIVRHIEMGEGHYAAARKGTSEIGLAVAATTFSIVAVFLPVAFIYGVAGQWFRPFALTIAASVLVSLFVSFSLDPMLSAYWSDPQVERQERHGRLSRALAGFNAWFERQADRYKGVIAWALDHRFTTIGLVSLAMITALAAQYFFGGQGFVPTSDRSEISIVVETPPSSSIDYTRRKVDELTGIVRAHPEVAYVYASLGGPIPLRTPGVDQALVYVRLVPKKDRRASQEALGQTLRVELKQLAGTKASIFTSGFGGAFKTIDIQLRGKEATSLAETAEKIQRIVEAVPGAVDVGLSTRGQKPEVVVEPNRGLAGSLGVSVAEVAQSLRPAFAGVDAGYWVDPGGETRKVRVRLAPEARESIGDLEQLPLFLRAGERGQPIVLPVGQVASLRQEVGPAQINHLDRDRVIDVQANVQGRSPSEVLGEIQARLRSLPMPAGNRITQGGDAQDQREVFSRVFVALGVALLLMYLILVIQFGSFLDPLAILISLPLSLIGVVLALFVTHDTLNIMSLIGVILLMGIVAKNAILLIDFAKWERARGTPLRQALILAGRIRLRPIVMTTVAIVAGMIPVALGHGEGADFRAPLGRAVIGGVITATLLTLLVIPTIYELLDRWRERFLGRLPRLFGRPPKPAVLSDERRHGRRPDGHRRPKVIDVQDE